MSNRHPLRSVCAALLLLSTLWPSFDAPALRAENTLTGYRICLDPGHGGDDPGIVNGALRESDITLDVMLALGSLLESQGAAVIMTRAGDATVAAGDRILACNDANAHFLLSLHLGEDRLSDSDGTTTRYFQPDDKALAVKVHQAVTAIVGPVATDGVFTDFGLVKNPAPMLKRTAMPAAQPEPVFLSNPAEAAALAQSVYDPAAPLGLDPACNLPGAPCRRLQIVRALYFGVFNYLGIAS